MDQLHSLEVVPEAMVLAAEHAEQGIVVLDSQLRLRWLNRAAERLGGVQRRNALGQPLAALVPAHLQRRFTARGTRGHCRLDAMLHHTGDVELIRHDGSRQWVSLHSHRLHGSGLRVLYLTDVQHRRLGEERIGLLSLGFDQADAAVLITDPAGNVLHVNRGLRRLLGFSDGEVVGRQLRDLLDDSNTLLRSSHLMQRLGAGQSMRGEIRVRSKDGSAIWCELSANPVADDNGRPGHLVVMLTEITESRVHALLLNQLLEALARDTPTAEVMQLLCSEVERIAPDVIASVIRIDENGCMRPLAGPSLPAAYIAHVDGVQIGPGRGACGSAAWSGKTVVCADIATDPNWAGIGHHALDNGLAACWSTPVLANDGRILGTFAFYYRTARDPDPFQRRLVDTCVHLCAVALERDLIRQRVHHLAHHDHLTGLPNRSQLQARASQALAAAERARHPLAVLSLHLERFKQVNDVLGQGAGDNLLRQTAQRMQSLLGPADVAGRLSGNEFAVVIADCDAARARAAGQQLLELLATPMTLGQSTLCPQVNIGISLYPEHADSIDTLLQQAGLARMQGRQHAEVPLHFYSEAMDAAMQERRALEDSLRQAVAGDGTLAVYYQPQINLAHGQLHSVEALARWTHPLLGEIAPARFIPLAEECGVIGDLGMRVLGQACTDLRSWQDQGLGITSLSVNLSATDFRDPTLPSRVSQQLDSHGVLPGQLTLEITEAVVLDRHPDTLRTLRDLDRLGVRLSLDDFGTGYSSFGYLRELPVAEIKLDQSFVCNLDTDAMSCALAEAVAHIGARMNLGMVAEGVTNQAQVERLALMGFTAAQGYHYTQALSAGALGHWLQNRVTARG